jgi:hypothetical protein
LVRQRLRRIEQRQGLCGAAASREPLGDAGRYQRQLQGSGLVVAIFGQVGLRIPQGIGDGQHRQAHRLAEIVGVGIEVVIVVIFIFITRFAFITVIRFEVKVEFNLGLR